MDSEKVKEIKKALECCTTEELLHSCNECPYRLNDRCSWKLDSDALTLINELESENERLRKCREADYKTMTALRQANTELNECMDEMQDRIAELEKEIKETPSYAKGYADGIKNTYEVVVPDKLKQFAERLKEKSDFYRNGERIVDMVTFDDIDETLKELKEQV